MLIGRFSADAGPDFMPLVHARALRLLRAPGSCGSFQVAPGGLAAALDGLRALGFRGASLAGPHQRAAAVLCEDASPEVKLLGRADFVTFGPHAARAEL